MINRVKNMLVGPKAEWPVVAAENSSHIKVFTGYVVPLALIPAIAAFIGYGLVGHNVLGFKIVGIGIGISQAVVQYITMLVGIYVTAFIIDALATGFGAKKDFNQAFSLVAYSYTPMFVAGVFNLLPALSLLAMLAGLYSLYLLYIGLQPMMKVPAEKQTAYFIVSLLVMIVVSVVLSIILGAILLSGAVGSLMSF